jgi:hypothetical protein
MRKRGLAYRSPWPRSSQCPGKKAILKARRRPKMEHPCSRFRAVFQIIITSPNFQTLCLLTSSPPQPLHHENLAINCEKRREEEIFEPGRTEKSTSWLCNRSRSEEDLWPWPKWPSQMQSQQKNMSMCYLNQSMWRAMVVCRLLIERIAMKDFHPISRCCKT